MKLRFLFLFSGILLGTWLAPHPLQAACEDDSSKEAALNSGNFSSCGNNAIGQGNPPVLIEFGTPQKHTDEEDDNSPLTPIQPTDYNNPDTLKFFGNSNVKFHFYKFLNNAEITISEASKLDLQLYNSNVDLKFTVGKGEMGSNSPDTSDSSVIIYRGGTTGKVSVYLPTGCNGGGRCFYTNSRINYLDFQGLDNSTGASPDLLFPGGLINIGLPNEAGGDTSADVVIDYIKGNGSIEVNAGSKLTIKNYEYDDINRTHAIASIRGDSDSEVIFDTKVYIDSLSLGKATFNYYSKILGIDSRDMGEYVFNANSDIYKLSSLKNIQINKNSHVVVEYLNNLAEANISKGSTLEFLGKDESLTNNVITKVEGEGTLWINPTNWVTQGQPSFKISDINLNTLLFDEGDILLSNSSAYYTNSTINDKGDIIESDPIIRRIKNINRSNDTALGGTMTVEGTVVFDNIAYLNKLVVCGEQSQGCGKNTNLIIKKVQQLNELEINDGKLLMVISNDNNIDNSNPDTALSVGSFKVAGGEFVAVIQDTTTIKNKNTYRVMNAQNFDIKDFDKNLTTSLPSWYKSDYYINAENSTLMLDVERIAGYRNALIQSEFNGSSNVFKFAGYFDSLIDSQVPLSISAKTLTYLDLLSDEETLGANIQSLIPLSKNTYIKTSHASLKEALDVSKSNGLANRSPFGVWDKRQLAPAPKDNLWVVYFMANGEFDNPDIKDSYKAQAAQFGYSFYNRVSPNNAEGQTFNLVGGFSRGGINNYNQDTNISAFNVGGLLDYRDENDILKFSLFYGYSSFDTNRDYFISNAGNIADVVGDAGILAGSRLNSSPTTHEILFDVQYSKEMFIEYLSSFANWNNVILKPKVFITPSLLIGSSYQEDGEVSSVKIGSYATTILESGGGFDVSKEYNLRSNFRIKFAFGTDVFYRYYNIPANSIEFAEAGSSVSLGKESSYSGMVAIPQVSTFLTYKSSQLSSYYKREIASKHYQNIVGFSYKYSF
ncbi:MAG: hypothetical protein LBQ34_01040 [Alphaproteobacteria bacterium]|jgi:hypothetical protein|nr:hypothetical protein [Alphaproteobacteria bacterium]